MLLLLLFDEAAFLGLTLTRSCTDDFAAITCLFFAAVFGVALVAGPSAREGLDLAVSMGLPKRLLALVRIRGESISVECKGISIDIGVRLMDSSDAFKVSSLVAAAV